MLKPIILERNLDNANGRNWPGVVVLDRGYKFPAAVLAQEWYEAIYKLNPVNLIKIKTSKNALREMEIMSHEIEVRAEVLIYGSDTIAARNREVKSMINGYDGLFKNYDSSSLYAKLRSKAYVARLWVNERVPHLLDYR